MAKVTAAHRSPPCSSSSPISSMQSRSGEKKGHFGQRGQKKGNSGPFRGHFGGIWSDFGAFWGRIFSQFRTKRRGQKWAFLGIFDPFSTIFYPIFADFPPFSTNFTHFYPFLPNFHPNFPLFSAHFHPIFSRFCPIFTQFSARFDPKFFSKKMGIWGFSERASKIHIFSPFWGDLERFRSVLGAHFQPIPHQNSGPKIGIFGQFFVNFGDF